MSESQISVSYDRVASEPLKIEWLNDPDQVSEAIALGVMRTLGAAYASSPRVCEVVHPADIWKHFVPMTTDVEPINSTVDTAAITQRRRDMQRKISSGVSYGLASDADRPSFMTGLIKISPSDCTRDQKLRRKFGLPSSNLFVGELIETPKADGAALGLLHSALSHQGYDSKRELAMDIYNKDLDQRRIAMHNLELKSGPVGSTYELAGVTLYSTRFGGQSIARARRRLEAYSSWLMTGAPDAIDTTD